MKWFSFSKIKTIHLRITFYPIEFSPSDGEELLRKSVLAKEPYPHGIFDVCCETITYDSAVISKDEVLAYVGRTGVVASIERETDGIKFGF